MKQSELKGLDKKVEKIYEYGCYFLDLLFISKYQEPTFEDIINSYNTFITKGWIKESSSLILNSLYPIRIEKFTTGSLFFLVIER